MKGKWIYLNHLLSASLWMIGLWWFFFSSYLAKFPRFLNFLQWTCIPLNTLKLAFKFIVQMPFNLHMYEVLALWSSISSGETKSKETDIALPSTWVNSISHYSEAWRDRIQHRSTFTESVYSGWSVWMRKVGRRGRDKSLLLLRILLHR